MNNTLFRLFEDMQRNIGARPLVPHKQVANDRINRIARHVKGFSSPQIMATINSALRVTTGGYLEIGVLGGKTMLGAMVGNLDRCFVGVDNFSEFNADETVCRENIEAFSPRANFELCARSYWEWFGLEEQLYQGQFSVYFYDAAHGYEHQVAGLQYAVESGILTDEAFIAVDDFSWDDPKRAVANFLQLYPEWIPVLEVEDDWGQKGWWNGFALLYRRRPI